jgi:hypothetical protein
MKQFVKGKIGRVKLNTPLVNKNIKPNGDDRLDHWIPGYNGKVHCCRVPGPGVVYVRRNKMPTWSGNSQHGQKGTVGMIYRGCDMPRTRNGIVPDLIVNPHAIPSRMTIAHLMEAVGSKGAALMGMWIDGSPFEEIEVGDLSRMLLTHCGYEPYGNEIMYSGITGEQMATEIFMTPIYYQRLKHMVVDKMHCLHPDHDVLTFDGWKPIADVRPADLVQTLNRETGVVSYAHPLETLTYDYAGPMYEFCTATTKQVVTPEHRMVIVMLGSRTPSFAKAEDLYLRPSNNLVMMVLGNGKHEPITSITQLPTNDVGKVYCLRVPTEVFMVRHHRVADGAQFAPVWTGNSRGSGMVVSLTRQPAEGRAREGGLRFGEMERDAIIAHGVSAHFGKERLLECSDNFEVHVCRSCGLIAVANPTLGIYNCAVCNNRANIAKVRMPYACKLVIQELEAMNISSRLITEQALVRKFMPSTVYYRPGDEVYDADGAEEVEGEEGMIPQVGGEMTGYDLPAIEEDDEVADDDGDAYGGGDGDEEY